MCEFGRRGVELLREIMSHDQHSLPAYNDDLVRLVFSEIEEHDTAQARLGSLVLERQKAQQQVARQMRREARASAAAAATARSAAAVATAGADAGGAGGGVPTTSGAGADGQGDGASSGGAEEEEEEAGDVPWQEDPMAATAFVIHMEAVKRCKRHLLIYTHERTQRLRRARWARRGLPEAMKAAASQQEIDYFKAYDAALGTYMSKANGVGMDLTLDTAPPCDRPVTVRGLKEHGEVMFGFGRAKISPGVINMLPMDEAEPLIREGIVEVLHTR